jgi:hypothetical protein
VPGLPGGATLAPWPVVRCRNRPRWRTRAPWISLCHPCVETAAAMLIAPTKVVLAAVRFSFMCTPSIGISATCADALMKTDPASDQAYPELTVG